MDLKTLSSMLLTREQVKSIFGKLTIDYGNLRNICTLSTVLPPFNKLGILVYIDGFAESKQTEDRINEKKNFSLQKKYSCIQCRRVLPTAHLLDLHISEQHDLYFAASVERSDTAKFSCYVEECSFKFNTLRERVDHCITLHKFPAYYRFDQQKLSNVPKEKDASAKNAQENVFTPLDDAYLPYFKSYTFGHPTQRTFCIFKERRSDKALRNVQALKIAINNID